MRPPIIINACTETFLKGAIICVDVETDISKLLVPKVSLGLFKESD